MGIEFRSKICRQMNTDKKMVEKQQKDFSSYLEYDHSQSVAAQCSKQVFELLSVAALIDKFNANWWISLWVEGLD